MSVTFSDLESQSQRAAAARGRLHQQVTKGAEAQMRILERVTKAVIIDRLEYPIAMSFFIGKGGELRLSYKHSRSGKPDDVAIHSHALGQLASATDLLPRLYARKLNVEDVDWMMSLLEHNFNEVYHNVEFLDRKGAPKKFLHRTVDGVLRGFMTQSYNPFLVTPPLIRAFIETCAQFDAGPVEAHVSDIKIVLKCMLPYVFEPVDGEFVAFGCTFANSDFGAGSLGILPTCSRISSGTVSVLDNGYRRVHLGRVLKDADFVMDSDTAKSELETHQKAIKNAVSEQLKPENIKKLIRAIQLAHEEKIEWYKLKGTLQKILVKEELQLVEVLLKSGNDSLIDLPKPGQDDDGNPTATAWWASNVVAWMSRKEDDLDRKQKMQTLAGSLLGKEEAA